MNWIPEENAESECDTSAPQFVIRHANNKNMEIKSSLFDLDSDGWVPLKIIR